MSLPSVSVVLSTYEQPRALALALEGYARQSLSGFQVVVADDGSGPETRRALERSAAEHDLELVHVRHEDRGFRKTEILDRALLSADGDYVVFSDGDCVPRDDFLDTHARLAGRGRFLSGGYLKLPGELTERLTAEDVRTGRIFDPKWLIRNGWRPGRRRVRLFRSERAARLLDLLTPTRPTWNGHNASTWKDALLEVNGFDLDMGYGGEDRALGERLENLGLRGHQIRHRAPVVHLHHPRPWKDRDVIEENRRRRRAIRGSGRVKAERGIEQLSDEEATVRRLGGRA